MFKRSIIYVSVIILSCFYFISCKSSSVQSDLYLTINTNELDNDVKPYLKKIRIVANSNNPACTNKKLVTLGTTTTENEIKNSFNTEENFVTINSNNSVRLNPNCLPYAITLGYWCDEAIVNGTTIAEKGLCYINEPPVTEGTTKTIKGTKVLQVSFTLEAQGKWKNLKPTLPLTSSVDENMVDVNLNVEVDQSNNNQITKPLTLANFFDDTCITKKHNDPLNYESFTNKKGFYLLFRSTCNYANISNYMNGVNFYRMIRDERPIPTVFTTNDEVSKLYPQYNIIKILEINGKTRDIKTDEELQSTLYTPITSGFKISIITTPTQYQQNDMLDQETIELQRKQ